MIQSYAVAWFYFTHDRSFSSSSANPSASLCRQGRLQNRCSRLFPLLRIASTPLLSTNVRIQLQVWDLEVAVPGGTSQQAPGFTFESALGWRLVSSENMTRQNVRILLRVWERVRPETGDSTVQDPVSVPAPATGTESAVIAEHSEGDSAVQEVEGEYTEKDVSPEKRSKRVS